MTILPRSMFWRLMLVLVLGLILAQVIGSMILLRDRDDALQQNLGLHLINRVTAVVKLLEETSPDKWPRIIAVFDSPDFRVSITDQSLPREELAITPRTLTAMLRRDLPTHHGIMVSLIHPGKEMRRHPDRRSDHPEKRMPPDQDRGWSKHNRHPGFQAQVQLSNGKWVVVRHPVSREIRSWRAKVLTYLTVLLISILLLSYIAVRYVTRPLALLANAADDLGRDIQSPPLEEKGPAEVRRAARAFNTMQGRLRRYIDDRDKILAAVSHDLKTPITRLRLRTEMLAQDQVQDKFNQDLDDMEQMVNATLDFMRGTESSEKPVLVDIMAMLEALQQDMDDLGCKVELQPAELKPYPARPLLLKRCFTNLIENAVRYGEQAEIRLEQSKDQLRIIIADQGPGIPEQERERVFRPFVRGESSRSRETGGTGLGLSIARNIAHAHGGELTLRSGKGGVGLEAVVTLPLVAD
ncbi:MAG: ATP-binding protein [Gammaproteobacteria bacterium]